MSLAESIKQYYFDNLDTLPKDKQFHFASRILSWDGDEAAAGVLRGLRSDFAPKPGHSTAKAMLLGLLDYKSTASINAPELRRPYFDQYPRLRSLNLALFRTRHLGVVYGVDLKSELLEVLDRAELDLLAEKLVSDYPALRILSTYAINFLYMHKVFLSHNKTFIDLGNIIKAAKGYDLDDKAQVQLLIYLFTHCVIGETNFYAGKVSPAQLPLLQQMLKQLERLIGEKYPLINLDNKLEFLVSCRICDYETPLVGEIHAECAKSVSPLGTFLIDRFNLNAQKNKTSVEDSEHRNVLYLMSCSDYSPHSTFVG